MYKLSQTLSKIFRLIKIHKFDILCVFFNDSHDNVYIKLVDVTRITIDPFFIRFHTLLHLPLRLDA